MSVKVNDILSAIKTKLLELTDLSSERVHLGPIEIVKVQGINTPHVMIGEIGESGERNDGTGIRRELEVEVLVAMRIDVLKGDAELRINEIYQPIHAKLEELRDGLADTFLTMVEDDGGPESELVWDQIPLRVKTCAWTVTFDRTLGATE